MPRTIRSSIQVEGPLNKGVVNLHMAKRPEESDLEYKYLTLDVKGHQRIYLENADEKASPKKKAMKMFGVRWG
ncbi:MAG: mitochondrial import inner membrane translocase subunit tim21 [Piccolia ochrophora]|nr:MAG: mitochondrial import inner membrane translocase subunit tim21 [Piccolia ochrophora]